MSEGAPRHTSVVSVSARDPEGATVTYSIVSGDTGAHFSIGESTGVIRVMQALDREEVRLYSLVSWTSFSDITHDDTMMMTVILNCGLHSTLLESHLCCFFRR